jgi:hypothetical protein
MAARVLGLAVPGLGHQLQQAGAGLAEVCEYGVPEFMRISSGPVDRGRGVEQFAAWS